MIQIAVCEDDPVLLDQLAVQVKGILDRHSIIYHLELFSNGGAVLSRDAFDILLLDIAMKPVDGLTLARKLRERGEEGRIIFITAYREYAIEAYDVQAFHYLLKPVEEEKLEGLLLKLCASLEGERQHAIAVRQGTSVRRVPLDQIRYLEVLDRKIYVHMQEETIPFYGRLEALEPELPEQFFRCHRSYIVNLGHVRRYDRGEVQLDSGEAVPLSKRRYKAFGIAFLHYLRESGDVF